MMAARQGMDVERFLTWTFRDQMADMIMGRAEQGPIGRARDSVVTVMRNGILGCRPSTSIAISEGDVHPDAERVAFHVLGHYRGWLLGEIAQCARTADRPDWCPEGVVILARRYPGSGKVVVRYDANRKPSFCELEYLTEWDWVEARRREYRQWHAALVEIAETFSLENGGLAEHYLTGPDAPAEPWRSPIAKRQLTPARSV